MKFQSEIYVHLGDENHRPMQTVHAPNRTKLRDLVANAKRDKWPYKIALNGRVGFLTLKEALECLPAQKRSRRRAP